MRMLTQGKVARIKLRKLFEDVSLDDMYINHDEKNKSIFKSDMYQLLYKVGLVASESWW